MAESPEPDLDVVLRNVRNDARVERLRGAVDQAQREQIFDAVQRQIGAAVRAGASTTQVAEALGAGRSRAQERVRQSRRAFGAKPRATAPSIWRAKPSYARIAPPPWPVHARCWLDKGHSEAHYFDRPSRDKPDGDQSTIAGSHDQTGGPGVAALFSDRCVG